MHKSQINFDYYMIIDQIYGELGEPKILVFVDSCQLLMDKNTHWLGFLNQFKKQVTKVEAIIVEKIMTVSINMNEANLKNSSKDEFIANISE